MSGRGICVALTCATLLCATGFGPAAWASEDCSRLYRACNLSCNQRVSGLDTVAICRIDCDFRLIVCDGQSVNASNQVGRFFFTRPAPGGNDALAADRRN